jgi:hypothetical protein
MASSTLLKLEKWHLWAVFYKKILWTDAVPSSFSPSGKSALNLNHYKTNRLIWDLQIFAHVFFTCNFIRLHYVVDFRYSMLLGRPWLQDANIAHDSSNNMVTIQGNGRVKTIAMINIWVVM